MKKAAFIFYFIFISLCISSCNKKEAGNESQDALTRLLEGNKRYVSGTSLHQSESKEKEAISKQSPYAIIVGCSDSRVPPEIIFDQDIGDLFVVRVAGNVIGQIELESIGYSAHHLHSEIILVLGHENCGAVTAVMQNETEDIKEIAKLIEPAIENSKKLKSNNLLEESIKTNAINMKRFLEKSKDIKQLINEKKIKVVAAYYNLHTNLIEILDN